MIARFSERRPWAANRGLLIAWDYGTGYEIRSGLAK